MVTGEGGVWLETKRVTGNVDDSGEYSEIWVQWNLIMVYKQKWELVFTINSHFTVANRSMHQSRLLLFWLASGDEPFFSPYLLVLPVTVLLSGCPFGYRGILPRRSLFTESSTKERWAVSVTTGWLANLPAGLRLFWSQIRRSVRNSSDFN